MASFAEVAAPSEYDNIYIIGIFAIWSLLYIIGVRRTSDALEKKTSPDIWWIQKVVVPLHSQLKREGYPSELGDPTGQRCLIRFLERCTASRFGGFLPSVASERPMGFLIPMGLWKKTSPNIWWFQKLVVPLHSQPARKRQFALHV